MRKTIARLTLLTFAAISFAGSSSVSLSFGEVKPGYEIRDADRGLVRRVKVLLDGRTIATIVFSRGRTLSSAYCCTADGCKEIAVAANCSTFKMTCDKDGACKRG